MKEELKNIFTAKEFVSRHHFSSFSKHDVLEYLDFAIFSKEEVAPEVKEALKEIISECDKYESGWVFARCIIEKWPEKEPDVKMKVRDRRKSLEMRYKEEICEVLKDLTFEGINHIRPEDFYLADFECMFPSVCKEGECEFNPTIIDKTYCIKGDRAEKIKEILKRYWEEKTFGVPKIPDILRDFVVFVRGKA